MVMMTMRVGVVDAYPFTRSDLDMWCQEHAGVPYRRWPGWAPAGALANFFPARLSLNCEELSLMLGRAWVCTCVSLSLTRRRDEPPAKYVHSPSV